MSVRIEEAMIFLEDDCGVEDAEALASALESGECVRVNLSKCRQIHSAVVQALLSFGPVLEGTPDDDFLTRFVLPALVGPDEPGAGQTRDPSSDRPRV